MSEQDARIARRKRKLAEKLPCSASGCDNFLSEHKRYCDKHYSQFKRYGKVLTRTIFDKNEILIKGKIAYLTLYKNNKPIGKLKFDKEDVGKVKPHKWTYDKLRKSVSTRGKKHGPTINLRNLIKNVPQGLVVIVKNEDPLDLRKRNLKTGSLSERNEYVKKPTASNTSGIRGVSFVTRIQKWTAQLLVDGVTYWGGNHDTIEGAAKARKALELRHWKKNK